MPYNHNFKAAEEDCNVKPTTPKSPTTKRSHSESSAQEESGDASGPSPAKKKRDRKKKNKKKLDQDATDDNGSGIKKTNSPAEITDADNEETSETKVSSVSSISSLTRKLLMKSLEQNGCYFIILALHGQVVCAATGV